MAALPNDCALRWTRDIAKRSLAGSNAGVVPKPARMELTIEINGM
jgi:hypothetical protein